MKRWLCAILALVLCVGTLPMTVLAASEEPDAEAVATEETTEEATEETVEETTEETTEESTEETAESIEETVEAAVEETIEETVEETTVEEAREETLEETTEEKTPTEEKTVEAEEKITEDNTAPYAYDWEAELFAGVDWSVSLDGYPAAKALPTLTGDQAQDVANIAKSQLGYGYSGGTVYGKWWNSVTNWGTDYTYAAWCAMFACWCANKAGAGFGVAYDKNSALTSNCLNYLRKNGSANTTFTKNPQPGDFIFFGTSGGSVQHVAVVTAYNSSTKKVTFVGGNQSGGYVTQGTCTWSKGSMYGSQYVLGYGRPNYKTVDVTEPTLKAWLSESSMGSTATTFYTGTKYYLCYKLYDSNSGKLMDAVSDLSYKVKITLYKADGSVWGTYTYKEDSQSIWFKVGRANSGTYKYTIQVTGDVTKTITKSFTVIGPPNPPTITMSQMEYTVGNTVKFTLGSVSDADHYIYIVLKDDDTSKMLAGETLNAAGTVTCLPLEAGTYYIYAKSSNNAGVSTTYSLETFTVYDLPATPVIGTDKTRYELGDTVSFTMSCSTEVPTTKMVVERYDNDTDSYVSLTYNDDGSVSSTKDLNLCLALNKLRLGKVSTATWTPTQAGSYRYRCASVNELEVVSDWSYCCFSIYETIAPPTISTDKAIYEMGDTVTVTRSTERITGYKTFIYQP